MHFFHPIGVLVFNRSQNQTKKQSNAFFKEQIKYGLLLWALLCFSLPTTAKNQPLAKWIQYGQKDGLSHDWINDMVADQNGLLWLAVGNSIYTYDGHQFSSRNLADFPYSSITHIYRDRQDKIWIQSVVGDLAWYDTKEKVFQPYAHNDQVRSLTLGNQVESFDFRADGSLYFGSRGKGYFRVTPEGKLEPLLEPSRNFHGYVLIEQAGQLPLIASVVDSTRQAEPFNLYFLDQTQQLQFQFKLPDNHFDLLPSLVYLPDSSFLFSTGTSTLATFDRKGLIRLQKHEAAVRKLFIDRQDGLWIGTQENGLTHYPTAKIQADHAYHYLDNELWTAPLHEDAQGGIWVGTLNSGLYHFPTPYHRSYLCTQQAINPDNHIPYLSSDNQQIYFITTDNHIGILNPNSSPPISYPSSYYPYPTACIFYDTVFQQLWVGTQAGATRYELAQNQVTPPEEALPGQTEGCRMIKSTSIDSVLCFIMINHYLLVKNRKIIYRSKNFETPIYDVVQISEQESYVSTFSGAWAYDGQEWSSLNEQYSQLTREPTRLLYTKGQLWLAPAGRELLVLEDSKIRGITYQGQAVRNVRNIFVDDEGIIWATAPLGFLKIQSSPGLPEQIEVFSQDFNLVKADYWNGESLNGQYYAATPQGIYTFDQQIHNLSKVEYPQLLINSVAINNQDTALLSEFQLNYQQNFIEVDFTGVGYHSSIYLPTRFQYRMLGLDTIWRSANKRSLSFTTLPPGNYQLQIKSGLGRTHFNPPQSIQFNIIPPVWQRGWFRWSSILLLGLFIYALFLYRSKQISRRERLKSETALALERLELRALKAQINPHFIFNSISSVQYYLAKNNPRQAESYLQRFAELMRKILDNSENTQVRLADEIALMRHYISLESERFEGEGIEFRVHFDNLDPREVLIPPVLFQPYIENAIWHGLKQKQGARQITIRGQRIQHQIRLEIEDNGIGRKAAGLLQAARNGSRSYGMMIASRRIELLNKTTDNHIQIEDLSDSQGNALGTLVILQIPYKSITHESVDTR